MNITGIPKINFDSLFSHQVIFVSGKGGTGKTTLSIFLAQAAAQRGKKVLVCHMNRLSTDPWEDKFLGRYPKISRIFIDSAHCFREYMLMKLKSEKLYSLIFENFSAPNVIRNAAPALKELLLLGKVYYEATRRTMLFTQRWDNIIVDMPSTGNAIAILNIPEIVLNIFSAGIIAWETIKIKNLINDHKRSVLVLVTIPEYMAMQETRNFISHVNDKLKISLGPVFINRVPSYEWVPSGPDLNSPGGLISHELRQFADFYRSRRDGAREQINEFNQRSDKLICEIPLVSGASLNPEFTGAIEQRMNEIFSVKKKP